MKFLISLLFLFSSIYSIQAIVYEISLTVSHGSESLIEGNISGLLLGNTKTQRFMFSQKAFEKNQKLFVDVSFPEEIKTINIKWDSVQSSNLILKPLVVSWIDQKDVYLPQRPILTSGSTIQFNKM